MAPAPMQPRAARRLRPLLLLAASLVAAAGPESPEVNVLGADALEAETLLDGSRRYPPLAPRFYTQWISSTTFVDERGPPRGQRRPPVVGKVELCQGDLRDHDLATKDENVFTQQTVLFTLWNLDPRCWERSWTEGASVASGTRQPRCTMAVVRDKKCGHAGWDEPHVAIWNKTHADEDPWAKAAVFNLTTARPVPPRPFAVKRIDNQSVRHGTFLVETGLDVWGLVDHTLSITDADGAKIACSQLVTSCKSILRMCVHEWARIFTLIATVVGVGTSMMHIHSHLRHNKLTALRKYTIRILLIVPLYSTEGCLALFFKLGPLQNELAQTVRELYEAVVIFSFLQFVLFCCGGPKELTASFDEGGRKLKHLPGFNCVLPPWRSAKQMLSWCIVGTLIYVVVGVLASTTGLILFLMAKHDQAYVPACSAITRAGNTLLSASQAIAIMSLAELADNLLEDLQDFRPLPKFLSVKAVVFFTFWQANVLKLLVHMGFFSQFQDQRNGWNSQEIIAEAVQNFLIVFEMGAASIVHLWVFPVDDYKIFLDRSHQDLPAESPKFVQRRLQVVDFRDIVESVSAGVCEWDVSEDEDDDEDEDGMTSEDSLPVSSRQGTAAE